MDVKPLTPKEKELYKTMRTLGGDHERIMEWIDTYRYIELMAKEKREKDERNGTLTPKEEQLIQGMVDIVCWKEEEVLQLMTRIREEKQQAKQEKANDSIKLSDWELTFFAVLIEMGKSVKEAKQRILDFRKGQKLTENEANGLRIQRQNELLEAGLAESFEESNKDAFVSYCENEYQMTTSEFITWYEENEEEGSSDFKLWYHFAKKS